MPIQLIRVARNLCLIGLALGGQLASAADLGQGTADDQAPPKRSRPNPVHFADGSALPADEGANMLTAVPAPTPTPAPTREPLASLGLSIAPNGPRLLPRLR